MLDVMVGEVGFELADALLASFTFIRVELASTVCEDLVWASVLGYGVLQDLDRILGCGGLEYAVAYDQS